MSTARHRRGLTAKLSLGSTIPMVLVMAVMGLTTILLVRTNTERLIARNADGTLFLLQTLISSEYTRSVQGYLRGKAESNRDLMALYDRRARNGELSAAAARREFEAALLDPTYGKVGTTGYLAAVSTRGILEIHPLSPGVDASGLAFMQQAMAMRNGYLEYEWKNVGESEARLKAGYLSYFAPWDLMMWASSYKDEFLTLLDLDALRATLESVVVDDTGYLVLVDPDGAIRAGRDRLGVVPTLPLNEQGPAAAVFRATAEGRTRVQYGPDGSIGWTIVVVNPMTAYDRMMRLLQLIIVATVIVSALMIHLFVRLLVGHNLRPLDQIATLVDQVAAGDLRGEVEVSQDDEIGAIAEQFNRLIGEFAAVLLKIRSVITVLSDSVQNLSTTTQEIASTSNEQAAAVKEVLSTMEDADRLSKGVENKVLEVARIAANTQENVAQGFDLIKTSLAKMEEIRTTNADTITGIKTLGDRIESIWDIVNIINGIADQTKIIAFNAELEAAAAGDAGKNFQIVAGEIRRLADGTVESTNEIKVKINEIQHASDKLIIASEQGTQRIREGWDVSNHIRGVFETVLSSSEISASSAGDISRSMKMQVASFEQIFLTLKQISESIDSFVESTAYTTEVADHLKEISTAFKTQLDVYTIEDEAHG